MYRSFSTPSIPLHNSAPVRICSPTFRARGLLMTSWAITRSQHSLDVECSVFNPWTEYRTAPMVSKCCPLWCLKRPKPGIQWLGGQNSIQTLDTKSLDFRYFPILGIWHSNYCSRLFKVKMNHITSLGSFCSLLECVGYSDVWFLRSCQYP